MDSPSLNHQPSTINHQQVLPGVPASAIPLVLAEMLADKKQSILHIAASDRSMEAIASALSFFSPNTEILHFPAWDCMPYDRSSPLPAIMAQRVQTLATLGETGSRTQVTDKKGSSETCNLKPETSHRVILTTASAVLQKLPPRSVMKNTVFRLAKGQRINRDELVHFLISQGYRKNGKAMESGEFALRGSIIDIVPSGAESGIRLDLFGDEIESLKSYDVLTQISQGTQGETLLFPMSEVLLTESSIEHFRSGYRNLFGAVSKEDPLYETISNSQHYPGMEHWLPLFYEHMETLFDYCPGALVTLDHEAETAISERTESILDYYQARTVHGSAPKKNSFGSGAIYNPVPPEKGFLLAEKWQDALSQNESAIFSPFGEGKIRPVIRFAQGNVSPFDQLKDRQTSGKPILIACYSGGSRDRLQTLLMERGFHAVTIENWKEAGNIRGKAIGLCILPIENGFETENLQIFSEQDILGERIARAKPKKKKSDVFMAEAANFAEGELVVHKEHGIGRFEGLVTLTVSGAAHDCLKIIYDGDDKLFLPVENIDMVSRFGLEEEGVRLDKLGGASWQSRKAKLKERITIAAEALLKIAAERQLKQATIIETPVGSYDDFCSRFPYVETEDQARAIEETLTDLASGKPMDRLICGDVGFGKTEVAMRAAFVVASQRIGEMRNWGNEEKKERTSLDSSVPQFLNSSIPHFQVALICPTTLLARQHFRNFRARFEGFPVTVRQLSRMVTPKEQKATQEGLAAGTVDIVIGTHALLSKQMKFKNLGLVIVDEEQHFGVAQKEKLKELKSDVHVLTLSATPIPRTLQMALTGVRDLSLITTPPVDRLAVRSFVMPFDPVVVKEAITREMHRGGRCFVVTPRIKHIGEVKLILSELIPEARICVAHGQLAASELDSVMNDFYDGKYDILLSTAIIESGLDIPTANTMIIHNAHLFGLAQLYQMRGRVGRGKTRAYAYFLLPHHRELTKNATRRLEVMQTLDSLGAGFTLASHDMDIRGFGNLVGEEQSGHIKEVGIELYQQMLEEAVSSLKSSVASENSGDLRLKTGDWSPAINLGLSVLIPETYVGDLGLRLGLYRRVADFDQEADIDSFAAELVDRFGEMPEEVQHLIAVLGLKLLCKKAGIERIDVGPKGAVITFRGNVFAKPDALLMYVERHIRTIKIRPDMKLVFTHEWKNEADKLATVKRLVGEIGGLAR